MKRLLCAAVVAASTIGFVSAANAATNIVVNGDFETGNLSGWTVNASPTGGYPWTVTDASATYTAETGCVGSACLNESGNPAYLYQDLNTTAGTLYNLTFDFVASGTPNALKVLWGSDVVLDLTNVGSLLNYSVSNLLATGGTTRLTFLGRNDPSYSHLDNVNVQAVASAPGAVPEPASWAMMILGFLGVGATVRSKRRADAMVAA